MVEYLPRSAWGARTPKSGPGPLDPSDVEGAVIHWPGMESRRLFDKDDVARALRGWQDYHMDDRGWSDIAYQVAVDQAGRVWTLRGLRTQSGANGNNDVNERYGAILLIVGSGEQPTPALVLATRAVIADFREIFPRGIAIRPHSAVRPEGTDCPGDVVRRLIAAGEFNPTTTHQEDDMTDADRAQLARIEKMLAGLISAEAAREVVAGNRYKDLANRADELDSEESGRYQYYAGQFRSIHEQLAMDDESPVTSADPVQEPAQ